MPPVGITFRRHAQKTIPSGRRITKRGRKAIRNLAENIVKENPGYKPKIFTSTENRTIETAEILKRSTKTKYTLRENKGLRGHEYFAGERIKTTKKDNLLTFCKNTLVKAGIVNDPLLIKIWLNGHFPKKIIPKPEAMADLIIKDRFKLPKRVTKMTDRTINFENITHDVVIAALFQRLSGVKYHKRFKELPKELESLRIDITKEGKATMAFRDYKEDITKRLNAILSS